MTIDCRREEKKTPLRRSLFAARSRSCYSLLPWYLHFIFAERCVVVAPHSTRCWCRLVAMPSDTCRTTYERKLHIRTENHDCASFRVWGSVREYPKIFKTLFLSPSSFRRIFFGVFHEQFRNQTINDEIHEWKGVEFCQTRFQFIMTPMMNHFKQINKA